MGSLEFFSDLIFPVALWPWGLFSLQQKWVPVIFPGGMCRLSRNSRRVNLLQPQGPVEASNGIDLPREGYVVNATPRPLYPREWPGTHCLGGWVGPGSGLAWKIFPHRDSIPDRLAHSESLYRLLNSSVCWKFVFNPAHDTFWTKHRKSTVA